MNFQNIHERNKQPKFKWDMKKNILLLTLLFSFIAKSEVLRPFAEYEKVKYLAFYAGFDFQTQDLKVKMVENLPHEIDLIVYAESDRTLNEFKKAIQHLPASTRLHAIKVDIPGLSFWTRDSFPQAVWIKSGATIKTALVNAKYPKDFEPDARIANLLKAPLLSHSEKFEHGNILSNRRGQCVIVNFIVEEGMPDDFFKTNYGCKKLIRLPYKVGIGHVDEVLKFIDDDTVLTQYRPFVSILEKQGFKVALLPELPKYNFRSYLNAIILNKTVYVPQFDLDSDAEALKIYASFGFRVIPMNASYVSDIEGGGLHCLSMTYPRF